MAAKLKPIIILGITVFLAFVNVPYRMNVLWQKIPMLTPIAARNVIFSFFFTNNLI